MSEKYGKIKEITNLDSFGMIVKLDNGVSVSISFNPDGVYLSFSGLDFDENIKIAEAELMNVPLNLSNYVCVKYKPNKRNM